MPPEERELTGGNVVLPASNPNFLISKVSGAIIGQFRKEINKPRYIRAANFEHFLSELQLVVDMKLHDLAGNPITYKHAVKTSKDLALNKQLPLEAQIAFLEFQEKVLSKLENLLKALVEHSGFKAFIQGKLDNPEEKSTFLAMLSAESTETVSQS